MQQMVKDIRSRNRRLLLVSCFVVLTATLLGTVFVSARTQESRPRNTQTSAPPTDATRDSDSAHTRSNSNSPLPPRRKRQSKSIGSHRLSVTATAAKTEADTDTDSA
jgi:cytoskeletal protein RodZ